MNDKPIIIVGTHADAISNDPYVVLNGLIAQMKKNPELKAAEIKHFIPVSLASSWGLPELKHALLDIALQHPQIGVLKAKVPAPLVSVQHGLAYLVEQNRISEKKHHKTVHYMTRSEFIHFCQSKDILILGSARFFDCFYACQVISLRFTLLRFTTLVLLFGRMLQL